jgi:hypothetical protein
MRAFALVAICLVAGCSDQSTDHALKKMSRREKLEQAASKPPTRSVYTFEDGQLVVLDITSVTGGFLDSQRCYVWRDRQFQTSSLQCPSQGEMPLPNPSVDSGYNY